MLASRFARILLIVTLVSVQTVYAGHGATHDTGTNPDCQFCLHASGTATALPGEVSNPGLVPSAEQPERLGPGLNTTARFPGTRSARAPPPSLP